MSDPKRNGPTAQEYIEQYSKYWGGRLEGIEGMGYMFIEKDGEGPFVIDTEGRKVMDFFVAGGVFNLGHKNPVIKAEYLKAVEEEDFGTFFWPSEAKGELMATMARTAPTERLTCSLGAVTGSEAVDEALKLARGATGRYEILYAKHAYHGHTGLSLTMMAADDMRSWAEPLVPGFRSFDFDDASSLAAIISNRTAAVILEPVQTDWSGRKSADPEFWQEVRRLCDENGAKLIIDEVITGMGRLGTVWGCEALGIDPDAICVGKGFSGGAVPMAGVICTKEMLEFWGANPYRSVSSYAWSNVGCRTTKKAIEETERLLPQALKVGDLLEQVILDSVEKYPGYIDSLERTGLIFSIKLNEDKFNALEAFGGMWENNVNIYPSSQHGPIVKVMPPLIFTEEHVGIFVEAWDKTMAAAEGGGHQQWF
ncbi:MAG: aspartate aminotransferase family protein [Amphritea sp.]